MDTDTLESGADDTDGQFRIEIEVPLALLQRSAQIRRASSPTHPSQGSVQIRRGFPTAQLRWLSDNRSDCQTHRDTQVAEELQTIETNILEVFPEDNTRPDELEDSPIVFSVSSEAVVSEIEQAIDMRATQINYEDRPADGWSEDLASGVTIIEQD